MTPAPISWPPSQWWDGDDGSWSSFALRVGSPEQIARVLPSTAGQQTWVVSPQGCPPGRHGTSTSLSCNESRGGLFDVTRSSSWQVLGNYSLDLEVDLVEEHSALYGLDTIALGFDKSVGGPALNSQIISVLATDDYYMGVFGLGHQGTNISNFHEPYPTFLKKMRNESLIPSLSWAYTAGAQYRSKGVFGSLTFGGYDRSRFVPNTTVSCSLASDITRDLVVGLQKIYLTTSDDSGTRQDFLLPNPIHTFIDSTLPYIYLPIEACQRFEKTLGLAWDSTQQMYWVNDTLHKYLLSKSLSFTFTIGNTIDKDPVVQIALPYASFDLEVKYPFEADTTRYFPLQQAVNESQYTLGRTLLQEAYIIVDYERSNFSISQCRFEDGVPADLVAIPTVTERPNHYQRNVVVGTSLGTASFLLLAALTAFLVIRRLRRNTITQLNSEATQTNMPFRELRASNLTQEIGHSSIIGHLRELPDSARVELSNGQTRSGSGNEIFEMSEAPRPGPHESKPGQGSHVMVQKCTADTWRTLFPSKDPRKSWMSLASSDGAPCVETVVSTLIQRKEVNRDRASMSPSDFEADIIALYVPKSIDLDKSLPPTPISESPQVLPALEKLDVRSTLYQRSQLLGTLLHGFGSASLSPDIRVSIYTATCSRYNSLSVSDLLKSLGGQNFESRAQRG